MARALAVIAIVLVGAALRVTGIGFGDPFVYHPDEWIIAGPAMTMAATGDWNPHTFFYPSLLVDLEALVAGALHAIGGGTLATGQPWLFENEIAADQFGYVLAGRLIVAILGTATILVVFETTRRLVGVAGALAAAIMAGARYLIASSWSYERFVDKPGTPREDAFYKALFALPEVFRVDAGLDRSGPTIRIFRLDPV